jgi:Flp pilus assembly protein TadG
MTTRRKLRGEEGAAAVEFALVVGLLFVILFGIMEFGLAFFETQNLRSATREGARAAAIGGTTGPNGEITKALVDGASGSLPANYSGYTLTPASGCTDATKGDEVEIVLNINSLPANVRAAFDVNIPFLPKITLTPQIRGSFRCE